MSQPTLKTIHSFWPAPVRLFHWLTVISLISAVSLTSQGDISHAALGWVSMGILLFFQIRYRRLQQHNPVLWLITVVVIVFNMSDLIAPDSIVHMGATMAGIVVSAFYSATGLFESLQRVTISTAP